MSLAGRILAQYQREFARLGEDVVIRRYTGIGNARTVSASATVRARVMGYKPDELVGAIVQGDVRVIALVDTLSSLLPIKTSDKVVIRGAEKSIQAVDDNTRRVGGTLIALELQVRG